MFTRVVEITTKQGKAKELTTVIADKILNILKNQPGFVDELVLVSETNPNQLLALSFWKSKDDAERYHREQFSTVTQLITPHVEGAPKVQPYNVQHSTTHRIAAGKAA